MVDPLERAILSHWGGGAPNMEQLLQTAILSHREESIQHVGALLNSHSVTGKKAPNMVQPLQRAILRHREEST